MRRATIRGARERARAQLRGPALPTAFVPLWEAFLDLHRWRGAGGMSAAPLTLHDIEVWERRFLPPDRPFRPEELDLLKRLDMAALAERD